MVRRREGGTHDDFQEDVITTACWPLHSLYGVWGEGRCGSCRVSFVTSLFVSSALCFGSGRPGNSDSELSIIARPFTKRAIKNGRARGREVWRRARRVDWKISQGIEGRVGTEIWKGYHRVCM